MSPRGETPISGENMHQREEVEETFSLTQQQQQHRDAMVTSQPKEEITAGCKRARGCNNEQEDAPDCEGECYVRPPPTKKRGSARNGSCPSDLPCDGTLSMLVEQPSLKIVELNNRAIGHFRKGDFRTASSLFQEAAVMRKKAVIDAQGSCDDDCSPLPARSTYIFQRVDFDEGMNVFSDTVSVHLGDQPAAVEAALLFNAGQARRRLEDFDGASKFYQAALDGLLDAVKVSGRSASLSLHRMVVPVLHNLGHLSYRKGCLREAIATYETALEHCKRISGKDTCTIGLTYNCLGVLYYHLSENENARALGLLESSREILNRAIGEESVEVATTLNNIGRVLVQKGDFAGAVKYYLRALDIRQKRLGTDHLDYAATAFNAGQSLHQMGEYDQAVALYNQFLKVAMVKFNKQHRDIAVVLSGIAQIYQERKQYKAALELYEQSLEVGRAALGHYHPEVAMLLNRLGNYYFETEDFDSALLTYEEGLCIEQRVLEKTHPNIIVTFSNIGEIYRQKGDYDRAIRLYTQAMKLQKIRHGEKSLEVAGALNVIGLIFDQKGETTFALQYLQEALVIRRSLLGDDHVDVAATITYLGTVFYRRNMISMALGLFSKSLTIRMEKLGRENRDVAFTLYNIGLCHQSQGENQEAIKCFRETLRIEESLIGKGHKDVALTLFKLGEAFLAENLLHDASETFQRAVEIERRSIDSDPTSVAKTLNAIGNIHLLKGEVAPMMAAFIEAGRLFRRARYSITSVKVSPALKLQTLSMYPSAAAA